MKHCAFVLALLATAALPTGSFCADPAQAAPPPVPAPPALPGPVPAPPASGTPKGASEAPGPKIAFDDMVYDFGKALAGDAIKHVFTVTNTGAATLLISNVRPSCGCTTAGQWTKEIEPGKTGIIPVQINSANLRGPVSKTVTVTSNDKFRPQVVLQLHGTVWKAIEVNPGFAVVRLDGDGKQANPTVIHISNKLEEPLTLMAPEITSKSFAAELKTNVPGKEFDLIVSAVPPMSPGTTQGSIRIKTSFTNTPQLTIPAMAYLPQPQLLVTPRGITLASSAGQAVTNKVVIQSSSQQQLVLSEPSVNAKGVTVEVKTLRPGRQYELDVEFPKGFEVPDGPPLELSVKSNQPRFPIVRVPITKAPVLLMTKEKKT